jgi:hypothetical protein
MHDIDLMLKLQLKGNHEEARKISDKLEQLGIEGVKDNAGKTSLEGSDIWLRHCFNRGWFILQEGNYQDGCKLLENGRFINVYGSPPLVTVAPIFNPEKHDIKGKSIIISLEGGYGDEIIHARFATSFKKMGADKVYLAAAPELVSLFSRIPGVDGVILRNQANLVAHDYWVPGFSAGWVAGHTFEDFPSDPYIFPVFDSIEIWKTLINSEKKKIGIRWAGNPKFEHQQFRRFPENFITNISKYNELQLYSLQRDNNIIQLPENINDLQHFLISWEDTAAAIQNLDLIITSCTSVAHLSAAMGKETWILVPCLPYHTWTYKTPDTNTSPYYKNVRLFRQKQHGTWNDTFEELYKALEEKFNLEHIDMTNEDKEIKRLNLGCGLNKFEDYLNVDCSEIVKPDQVVDLNVHPWPWKDNEFQHIIAKDILEHLGNNSEDFINTIKEMYRISENGAVWEVQVPHWRCDISLDDPTHKRLITYGTFQLFNKKNLFEKMKTKQSDSILAFDHDIDIEICDVQFTYTNPWKQKISNGEVTPEEISYALNHFNNVAESMILLIQVHKPGRISKNDVDDLIENMQ